MADYFSRVKAIRDCLAVQPGTELNKANLLTDAAAALMDLGSEATPNDMLAAMCTIRPLKDGIQQNLTKRSAPEYNERAVLQDGQNGALLHMAVGPPSSRI